MNKGITQVERAEKAQQEDKQMDERKLHYAGVTEMLNDGQRGQGAELRDENDLTIAYVVNPDADREMVRRWNEYPRLMDALKTIEAKLHEGDAEDGSDDGEFIQDVRNLSGDYIGQLQDLGTIARGAIAVAAQ